MEYIILGNNRENKRNSYGENCAKSPKYNYQKKKSGKLVSPKRKRLEMDLKEQAKRLSI